MSPLHANVKEIPFEMMPDSRSMASFGDKLIVYDNISVPLSETYTDEIKSFVGGLPLKIDFTVVVFCLEGRINVGCNLQHYSIGPGDIAVFVPGTIGESIDIAPDSKLIVLSLSDDTFRPTGSLKKNLYAQANFVRPLKFNIVPDMIWPAVQEYQHLKHALLHNEFLTDELVASYIGVLTCFATISLDRWNSSKPEKEAGNVPNNKIYNEFMDLLGKNFIEHKDVAFYAEASGLSDKYFSRQIYKVSGKHPLEWIKAHVVLNAEAMLRSGEYTIAQVCEALKFTSQPAFNRYFKAETGISPKEYMKG
ncbi:MAG: AraC family transcriptional regulator [Bacteroidales bacterium]|nr:AraC family transcriptional regulator [Bacteroidales bacterium]